MAAVPEAAPGAYIVNRVAVLVEQFIEQLAHLAAPEVDQDHDRHPAFGQVIQLGQWDIPIYALAA
jgi:hypothetical protein